MLRKPVIAVVCTCVIFSGAQAARLTEIQGTVLVNTGEGFREVIGKTMVSAGDRVLVRGKGGAQIDYGTGCVTKISANQTVVIAAEPTCKAPQAEVSLKEAPPPKDVPVPPPFNDGLAEQRILIVGGLVVVGSAAAALASKGDSGKAASGAPAPDAPAPIALSGGNADSGSSAARETARVGGTNSLAPTAQNAAASGKIHPPSGAGVENGMAFANAQAPSAAPEATVARMAVSSSEAEINHEAAAFAFNGGELSDGTPVSP